MSFACATSRALKPAVNKLAVTITIGLMCQPLSFERSMLGENGGCNHHTESLTRSQGYEARGTRRPLSLARAAAPACWEAESPSARVRTACATSSYSAVPLLLVPALERMVRSWSREITPGNLATAAFGPTDIAPSLVTKRVGPPYAAVLATARPTKSA